MMDNFEMKAEPKIKRKPVIWNILTILVLLGACYLAYYFFTIFINPNSPYNPFPPVALPTLYQTSTFTPTIIPKPATWTPTPTVSPVPSRTKAPTWTSVRAGDHSKRHHNANPQPCPWNADDHSNRHAGIGRYYLCSQYQNARGLSLQLDGGRRDSYEYRQSTSALSDCPVGR